MANSTITDLPAVPSATVADVYAIDQGGVTYKESITQLIALLDNQIQITLAQVTDAGTAAALAASDDGLPTLASVNGPTTIGDFAVFSDTVGTIRDNHFVPSSNALPILASVSGGVTINNLAAYADTSGTIKNGPALPLTGANGGTGVANTGSTITIGGNVTFSGAHTFVATLTNNTTVTFPTTGTLITDTVTSLPSLVTVGTIGTGVWHGTVIGATYGGTGVNNGSSTITIGGNVVFSGVHTFTATITGDTSITFPTSGTLITDTENSLPNLITVGTITTGVWQATLISPTFGGTGVNNGSSTITLGGNVTFSGAHTFTGIVSADTSITFPTSGTLVSTTVTSLPSLATVGTIGTGIWHGSTIATTYGGTGLSNPTAHGILVGEGASAVTPILLTNGQLLIGSTGADPVAATLTQGNGILITNAAGSITIASTAINNTVHVTGTTQSMAVDTKYLADNAGLVTLTLPLTAALGDEIIVVGVGAGGWKIAQNSSQLIHFGSATTTTGTGGSLASTNQFDTVTITCIVANTTFVVQASQGNQTVT